MIDAGNHHSVGIKADGSLWASGDNTYGQIGDGTTTRKYSLVQIGTATNWASIAGENFIPSPPKRMAASGPGEGIIMVS